MTPDEESALYRAVGERVRAARERQAQKLSQVALAKDLGISRASIVNIEAGRQHAPLHLLWQIAQRLDTDVSTLIPTRTELTATQPVVELNGERLAAIKEASAGDRALEQALLSVIGQSVGQLASASNITRQKRKS